MKKLSNLMVLFLLSALAQSCMQENVTQIQDSSFRLRLSNAENSLRLPRSSVALVDIETEDGELLFENRTLHILERNGEYFTEGLALPPGEIIVSNIRVMQDNKTIYVPVEIFPLPWRNGSISPLEVTLVNAKTGGKNFGITLYTPKSGKEKITSGTAYLISGTDTLTTYNLLAKRNNLSFDFDKSATYKLVVISKSYAKQTTDFVFNDLEKKDIRIDLTPAFTMLGYADPIVGLFEFTLQGPVGSSFSVDWSDGTGDFHIFEDPEPYRFTTYRMSAENRFITVTGDIDKITYFSSFLSQGMLADVSFEYLPSLNRVHLGLTPSPAIVDFSFNNNLSVVYCPGLRDLEQLILPQSHFINDINLSGPNKLSVANLDAVIANIYNNTVQKNITGGMFLIHARWDEDQETQGPIGPPSAASISKLTILRDQYSWVIVPPLENF